MRTALLPYATKGIAIAGASVIAASSVLPVATASLAFGQAASTHSVDLTAKATTLSPLDSVALANTLLYMGIAGQYPVNYNDIDDSDNVRWNEGTTVEYASNPTQRRPLPQIPRSPDAGSMVDALADPSEGVVETGDNRDLLDAADVGPMSAQQFLNIIPNLFNAILSIPMAEINAINRFSAAMEQSGSWWVYTPVNVLGWDPPNEEMTKGFVDMLLPFAPFSSPAGQHTFLWLAANLPMDAGCSGLPPCPHPESILSKMFTVGAWEFYSEAGYTFPKVINPISKLEGYWGQELEGEVGDPTNWSEQNYPLDPWEGIAATFDYLVSTPQAVRYPTWNEIVETTVRLTSALWKSWYPYVPQSTLWNPSMSLSAYLVRPFARVLCPDCNPEDPFMPVTWEKGDPIPPGAYVPPQYRGDYDENGNWIGGPVIGSLSDASVMRVSATDDASGEKPAEEQDYVASDSVQSLREKFELTKDEEQTPATETSVAETPVTGTPAAEISATEQEFQGNTAEANSGAPTGIEPVDQPVETKLTEHDVADEAQAAAIVPGVEKSTTGSTLRAADDNDSNEPAKPSEDKVSDTDPGTKDPASNAGEK